MNSLAYNIPTQLQKLGVTAKGVCMLARGWMSAHADIRAYVLELAWSMTAAKALPRPGQPPARDDAASQLLLGNMTGQDRGTVNRHVGMFCGVKAKIVQLFNKMRPGIGAVNRYSHIGPAPKNIEVHGKQHKGEALLHDDPAKLAERFGSEWFNAAAEGLSGAFEAPMLIFDPNLPAPQRCVCRKGQMKLNFSSDCVKCGGTGSTIDPEKKMGISARLVALVLCSKGLISLGPRQMTSKEIGALCGLSENTVADSLDQWEDLKCMQIIPGEPIYEKGPDGKLVYDPQTGKPVVKCRKPQKLIWLQGLLMDHTIIERERERFLWMWKDAQERAQLNGWAKYGIHLDRIKALHAELLRRWTLTRHSISGFMNAMRKLIWVEGIPCGRKTGHTEDYRDLFPVWELQVE